VPEKNVIRVLANPGLPPSGKGDPFESCRRPITAFCALKRHKNTTMSAIRKNESTSLSKVDNKLMRFASQVP